MQSGSRRTAWTVVNTRRGSRRESEPAPADAVLRFAPRIAAARGGPAAPLLVVSAPGVSGSVRAGDSGDRRRDRAFRHPTEYIGSRATARRGVQHATDGNSIAAPAAERYGSFAGRELVVSC